MLRLCCRTTRRCINLVHHRRCINLLHHRRLSSTLPRNNVPNTPPEKLPDVPKSLQNSKFTPSPPPPTLPIVYRKRNFIRTPLLALSATALVSGAVASYVLIQNDEVSSSVKRTYGYQDLEAAIENSNASVKKILHRMKQTGVAATVLWKSLRSVMSSANHEVRTGFELRVAAFLADIAAASESRRVAIVGAGGGAVIDWLLETVAAGSAENLGTQAEAARALAYLIADRNVCEAVLGRPHAIPSLLRFIFSAQPRKNKKIRSSFDVSDSVRGRSMLVAAIMEIVTSNCESVEKISFRPLLPKNAQMRDIAAAIEVIEEGGIHWDEPPEDDKDDKDGKGMKGIGIKILEGTTVLGLSRSSRILEMEDYDINRMNTVENMPQSLSFSIDNENYPAKPKSTTTVVPGLWDDLQSEHVAVPFAAWALASWAMASEVNRSHIQELDRDGQAVMAALMAPERSVKWHGSLVARLLLEDRNLPLNESVSDWGSSLLSTTFQAGKTQDVALAQVALSAFLVCIERSRDAREVAMEKGLPLIRETAEQMKKSKPVQESLAKVLEILCCGEFHMSLEESQMWSGILLPWVFGKHSSDALRASSINIISHILEDYGPSSLPISQGWLALLLTDILNSKKMALNKDSTLPASDKVKTQIDQSNLVAATQTVNQLASVVVNLAGIQLGVATDNEDTFPLTGLLSIEPFTGHFKNLKKDKKPKINAADSAVATLKGVKALAEVCGEDSVCLGKIVDYGVLCLLRRMLLEDDYEQFAAIEAYDASRALETQERVSSVPGETSNATSDSTSLRVPPTAHIRRHAARLLTDLSILPKVQKVIISDDSWLKWLEECANGNISGCKDHKIQSYARATLLNVLCSYKGPENSVTSNASDSSSLEQNKPCPRYADMIFLINPERSHWKCPDSAIINSGDMSSPVDGGPVENEETPLTVRRDDEVASTSASRSESSSQIDSSPFDIVFVHGLRGGPFKSWRLSEDKSSTKSGLVEKIDQEAGKHGTFWPGEWLSGDFPDARLFSLRYKTNLTQWSGATLPLQEVSSMLLEKLTAAGIGERPVVFVTHSMGGLVVKQMLFQAKAENKDELIRNTAGLVFYSCPHFGSKLADMPWRMGLVLRPAPSIGELRSGSPRLLELNDFIQDLYKNGTVEVLSFCETKVTPLVEGYGGWAFRMEIVPIESAYPGFGELVILESTDHINSCKPLSRADPSYKETLDFLRKLKERRT